MVIKEAEPDTAQLSENSGETAQPITLAAYEKYAFVYEQNPDFVGWISIEGTNID